VLLDYMRRGNRPYSALNVYDNLHGAVGKAVVPRILDKLAADGRLKSKTYGKAVVYWPDQAGYGTAAPEEMDALNARLNELSAAATEVGARKRALEAQLAAAASALSDEALAAAVTEQQAATAALAERLAKLKAASGAAPLVTAAQKAALAATLERFKRAWAARRAMVTEVVDSMAEGMERKPAAVMADIGVESDELAGVSIKAM
jgi:26S proteasome regulatory subunit (ATPase 3-interacting protein)